MIETKVTTIGDAAPVGARDEESERVTLVVYEDDGAGASTRVLDLADGAHLLFGRSRTANVQIESDRVSRLHAQFRRVGQVVTVEDTGSRNGTWVNGQLVQGERTLASGDEVVVGPLTIVVSIASRMVARPRIESTRYLDERLTAEVDRGSTYHRRFGLVMLRLSGPAEATDDASDRICAALRPMDVVAEYAPGVLAVVMPERDAADAEQAARSLLDRAHARRGEVSGATPRPVLRPPIDIAVGVAGFPAHGTTPGALIARALAALESVRGRADRIGVPPLETAPLLGEIVVGDSQMARVYDLVRKVADHPITVLVAGETGVGKEVIASAIHAASSRRDGPLVRLNCASMPETLLESELFGHEKGAFTGADRRKLGYFEAAHGGTLFLDEIGEMTPALQAKLLRVLEQRRITRVGGTDEIEVDVRVICATHRDLEAESRGGTFRPDLFFRISAFTIFVPALRDRPAEIEMLAQHFIRQCAAQTRQRVPVLSPAASAALRRHAWPGNVRELRNAIERAMVLHSAGVIGVEDLPDSIREGRAVAQVAAALPLSLDGMRDQIADMERATIAAVLESCNGSQTEAAKQLGISRRTLIYRMEKHGLKPPPGARKER
ncbi:MAG TPA: sigma 54-interacting transcriptional regulator [Kofleriaceae bacterium]|nr:sigma 54-interacting transcriptional regulator [Kofleriaceae bacterium]